MLQHSRIATLLLAPILVFGASLARWPSCLADEMTAVESSIRDLQSDQVEVRRQAAVRLGRLADRAAVNALIAALLDSDVRVRCESAKALGFIKSLDVVGPLVAAMGDEEPNVRFYAAYALGGHADYLRSTWHPADADALRIAELDTGDTTWKGLEIITAEQKGDRAVVEFKARFSEHGGPDMIHHERSAFVRHKGRWYYLSGEVTTNPA